jgi:hypothetical protein
LFKVHATILPAPSKAGLLGYSNLTGNLLRRIAMDQQYLCFPKDKDALLWYEEFVGHLLFLLPMIN